MQIKIWYMNKKGWRLFGGNLSEMTLQRKNQTHPLLRPTVATLEDTHTLLMTLERAEIPRVRKEHESLDDVFAWMQGENWSPNGEARPLIAAKGLFHTSMSVGDVMDYGGEYYMVAPLGFELIQ